MATPCSCVAKSERLRSLARTGTCLNKHSAKHIAFTLTFPRRHTPFAIFTAFPCSIVALPNKCRLAFLFVHQPIPFNFMQTHPPNSTSTTSTLNYRDTTVTDNEIRVGRAARNDLRVRLGDPIHVKAETSAKYATYVKVAVFEDSLSSSDTGGSGGKGKAVDEKKLLDAKVAPYFEGKFRPLHKGSVFATAGGVEFKVTFDTEGVKWASDFCFMLLHYF